MIKRFILLILLFNSIFMVFSADLPQPKNNRLYTEFVSYRTANYLKKTIISSGYIVMDGKSRFLFKQIEPLDIEIRKNEDKITYKREDMEPVEVDTVSNAIIFIFDDPEKLKEKYTIEKTIKNNVDVYSIMPKGKDEIKSILIIGIEDKIQEVMVFFKNKTELIYKFSNTVTGTKPDEAHF